ncbi:Uncharacterized protein GBIM_05722 [Gryllus bimaculatus]|nr:Uncharacterized protein GBIM_05722 [Gryllus bimaculatus]
MGKRKNGKDTSTDDETADGSEVSPQKRHKRHKHKKHKRKKLLEESEGSQDLSFDDCDPTKPSLKLKIKFGKEASDKAALSKMFRSGSSLSPEKIKEKSSPVKVGEKSATVNSSPKIKKKKGKGKDSGTSSEEERWLDAIESGKLEEVDDELKKIKPKDPKLMTARQRAMFERKTDKEPSPGGEQLMSLPSGYKEKVMTAEALQKAALKSQKRKQLADEKREKDKKKTMERLLKKQESKGGKGCKSRSLRKQVPHISYRNSSDQITISLPSGMDFPLMPQQLSEKTIHNKKCGVDGCSNLKKYSCSRTGVPLCSLECYKKNLLSRNA